ncbi:hypothetical protein FJ656_15065 [Schumannella luteola]|uniref:Uncharacterized protein n=1 Tax=Schumannella luteola TaxID=472059 RepID=A0A852YDZ3_9MICO|nr:hypothetical protein [Schumannella luteola]NYG99530.1 hypothetical protein [Schumannella luteola]TPX03849.1 hypothetical protein FJ656_15065 [Schumannella luteola]
MHKWRTAEDYRILHHQHSFLAAANRQVVADFEKAIMSDLGVLEDIAADYVLITEEARDAFLAKQARGLVTPERPPRVPDPKKKAAALARWAKVRAEKGDGPLHSEEARARIGAKNSAHAERKRALASARGEGT